MTLLSGIPWNEITKWSGECSSKVFWIFFALRSIKDFKRWYEDTNSKSGILTARANVCETLSTTEADVDSEYCGNWGRIISLSALSWKGSSSHCLNNVPTLGSLSKKA